MTQEQIVASMGVVFQVALWLVVLAIAVQPARVLRVLLGNRAISTSSPGTLQVLRIIAVVIVVVLAPHIYTQIAKLLRG
jgi:hypothetical protein